MKPSQTISRIRNFPWSLISLRHVSQLRYFGVVSLRQCSSHASIRVQRLLHLLHLYKLLYNERSVASMIRNIYGRWYRQLLRPRLHSVLGGSLLMSATAFSFVENGIDDDEIFKAIDLFDMDKAEELPSPGDKELILAAHRKGPNAGTAVVERSSNWESLITKDHFRLQRRPMKGHPYLYEYRCSGTYDDITPMAFFIAQMDLEYRKQWDRLVLSLDIIEAESNTGSEVVRWVTHFPYPMYPREYVYVRRACVDTRQGTFILTSKSVNHASCPRDDKKMVRVDSYYSCMVIKARGAPDENGFDYVLTYFDDPKAPFPQVAYNWMVNTGVLGFLDKVHNAAKALMGKRSTQQSGGASGQTIANWQRLMLERYNYSF